MSTNTHQDKSEAVLAAINRLTIAIPLWIVFCGVAFILGFNVVAGAVFLCGAALFVAAPFYWAENYRVGDCPYCGVEIHDLPKDGGLTCKACQKRVVFKDEKFHSI